MKQATLSNSRKYSHRKNEERKKFVQIRKSSSVGGIGISDSNLPADTYYCHKQKDKIILNNKQEGSFVTAKQNVVCVSSDKDLQAGTVSEIFETLNFQYVMYISPAMQKVLNCNEDDILCNETNMAEKTAKLSLANHKDVNSFFENSNAYAKKYKKNYIKTVRDCYYFSLEDGYLTEFNNNDMVLVTILNNGKVTIQHYTGEGIIRELDMEEKGEIRYVTKIYHKKILLASKAKNYFRIQEAADLGKITARNGKITINLPKVTDVFGNQLERPEAKMIYISDK